MERAVELLERGLPVEVLRVNGHCRVQVAPRISGLLRVIEGEGRACTCGNRTQFTLGEWPFSRFYCSECIDGRT
jgi:hypothetical protein